MDKPNLYWNVYKNLERELFQLAEAIHIDDFQMNVYSMKIADLLIRTSVEIESIAKELYFANGGTAPTTGDLYFDTDCLKYLNDKWNLEKKMVTIVCPHMYLSESERVIFPLEKCSERGKGVWKRAYQAVKHDRVRCLKKGDIKSFVWALAALYLLNVYYRDFVVELGGDSGGAKFDETCGSSVFSIAVHGFPGIGASGEYQRGPTFETCTYLIKATDATAKFAIDSIAKVNAESSQEKVKAIVEAIKSSITGREKFDKNKLSRIAGETMVRVAKRHAGELSKAFNGLRYQAILNKNECYDYANPTQPALKN